MWIYACKKLSEKDPMARFMVEQPFHASYGGPSKIRTQRLSTMPRVPQLEGIYIPSPHVNPHLMSLIKLTLFKPFHAVDDMDDHGNPLDPYKKIYDLPQAYAKRQKLQLHENPYEVFPAAWRAYWDDVVVPNALKADAKLAVRKEWPTIWECREIFLVLKSLALREKLIISVPTSKRSFICTLMSDWLIA